VIPGTLKLESQSMLEFRLRDETQLHIFLIGPPGGIIGLLRGQIHRQRTGRRIGPAVKDRMNESHEQAEGDDPEKSYQSVPKNRIGTL
jgi:hypothetical protein